MGNIQPIFRGTIVVIETMKPLFLAMRIPLFIIAFLMTMSSSYAQSLQLRGGLNYSTWSGADYSGQVGFYMGIARDIKLHGERIMFQPGIFLSAQPAKQGTSSLLMDYIQVPMLFNFKIGKSVSLLLGPQLGVLARATLDNGKDRIPVSPDYNVVALSPVLGISFTINKLVSIDLRTYKDILDANNDNNSMFVAQAGVTFSLNKKPVQE